MNGKGGYRATTHEMTYGQKDNGSATGSMTARTDLRHSYKQNTAGWTGDRTYSGQVGLSGSIKEQIPNYMDSENRRAERVKICAVRTVTREPNDRTGEYRDEVERRTERARD